MQRRYVDVGADPFQPLEEWISGVGRGVGDRDPAAEKARDDLGGLLGGELVRRNLDALAKHRVAGLQDMGSEGQHILDRDLLERLEPGYGGRQSAGGKRGAFHGFHRFSMK
jgi:hypothetical protein